MFTLWNSVACAAQNMASLIVFRFLAGLFGSSPLTSKLIAGSYRIVHADTTSQMLEALSPTVRQSPCACLQRLTFTPVFNAKMRGLATAIFAAAPYDICIFTRDKI